MVPAGRGSSWDSEEALQEFPMQPQSGGSRIDLCREMIVPGPTEAWEEGCLLVTHRFVLVPV